MALVDTVADGELELMYIYLHVSSTKPVALSLTILMIIPATEADDRPLPLITSFTSNTQFKTIINSIIIAAVCQMLTIYQALY